MEGYIVTLFTHHGEGRDEDDGELIKPPRGFSNLIPIHDLFSKKAHMRRRLIFQFNVSSLLNCHGYFSRGYIRITHTWRLGFCLEDSNS